MKVFDINELKRTLRVYIAPPYVIKRQRNEEGVDERLVAWTDKSSYIAEQYKVLRTNLYSLSPGSNIKTIVLTSAQPKEGKSITSCNLAVTLSLDSEKKTILIDADFRRPSVHNLFGLPRKPGFSDVLHEEISLDNFTKKPAVGNLYIMPSGALKTNPSEIMISSKIKQIIDQLKVNFDYILFDSPPVLNVTDSTILGSLCDAVILIVKAGVTQKNIVEEAFNMLASAQAKPKACVLTNIHFLLDSYNYYLYRYKYYKYYSKEKGESH